MTPWTESALAYADSKDAARGGAMGVGTSLLRDGVDLIRAVQDENTRLRAALAHSDHGCVYCELPAAEWAKCKSGFPGCARADDLTGCPEFGATQVLHAAEQIIRETIEGHRPDASFDDSMRGATERQALLHNVANETIAALQAKALIASGRN